MALLEKVGVVRIQLSAKLSKVSWHAEIGSLIRWHSVSVLRALTVTDTDPFFT